MCKNERIEDLLDSILTALENIDSYVHMMERRDKCRYLCRDRGRHHVECDYYEQKS
jgi:hypothetical protein